MNLARNNLWKNVFIRPLNREKVNREKYLKEIKKIDETNKTLPQPFEKIVSETIKIPVPPPVPKIKKPPSKRYSPERYRVIQK